MDASQALRQVVESSGLTHRQLSARLGRYGSYVSQALAKSALSPDTISTIAQACGYRLALMPIDGGDPIVIGDDSADPNKTGRIEQARALLIRATALLDDTDENR